MRLTLRDELLLVGATVACQGREIEVCDLVVDTGSASTLICTDAVTPVGIVREPDDTLHVVRGLGGSEVVFSRRVDRLQVESQALERFEIEVGGSDAGFDINGILGLDFLLRAGAILDLGALRLTFARGSEG